MISIKCQTSDTDGVILLADYGQDYCPSESLPDTRSSLRGARSVRGLHPNISQISGPSLAYCGLTGAPRNYYDQKTAGLRANFGRQVRFREGELAKIPTTSTICISYQVHDEFRRAGGKFDRLFLIMYDARVKLFLILLSKVGEDRWLFRASVHLRISTFNSRVVWRRWKNIASSLAKQIANPRSIRKILK